jgi:hypothetical protein
VDVPGHTQYGNPTSDVRVGRYLLGKAAGREAESLHRGEGLLGQLAALERCLVVPGQRDRVGARKLGNELRVMAQDVSPEEHLASFGVKAVEQAPQVLEVYAPPAARAHRFAAPALSQLEGLVAADVDAAAGEVLHQLAHQLQGEAGVVLGGCENTRGELTAVRPHETVRFFCAMPVSLAAQPATHVAEAVLVGDQLDSRAAAVRVEPAYVCGRQRRRAPPHALVLAVREAVLRVELEMVDAAHRKQLHDARQGGARRNAIAAHVEHVAAHRKVGPIANAQARQRVAALAPNLRQQRARVAKAALIGVPDSHDPGREIERKALGRKRGVAHGLYGGVQSDSVTRGLQLPRHGK